MTSDSSQAAAQQKYRYTALNQPCYAGSANVAACTTPPTGAYPYAFDNADNLTTNNGTTQQFNAADQLCWTVAGSNANACGSVPSGATTYTYDARGNRTASLPASGTGTCTRFDQANRLTQIQTGSGGGCSSPVTVATYTYDGDGMRQSKTVSGTTTHFTWSGSALVQEKAGTAITSYIYGPNGPVEQITGAVTTYLHHDQIGSTRLITDAAGATATAATFTFDPYGNTVSTTGSLTSHLMFNAEYLDVESGWYYLRARYYDTATAQFMSLDPAVTTTRSPYAYVSGNPVNATDPTGLFRLDNDYGAPIASIGRSRNCGIATGPGCDPASTLGGYGTILQGIGGILRDPTVTSAGDALGKCAAGLGGTIAALKDFGSQPPNTPTAIKVAHAVATGGGATAGAIAGGEGGGALCLAGVVTAPFSPLCAAAGAIGGALLGGWAGSSLADGAENVGNGPPSGSAPNSAVYLSDPGYSGGYPS